MINAQKLIELNSHEWEHHAVEDRMVERAIQCQCCWRRERDIAGLTKDNRAVVASPVGGKQVVALTRTF